MAEKQFQDKRLAHHFRTNNKQTKKNISFQGFFSISSTADQVKNCNTYEQVSRFQSPRQQERPVFSAAKTSELENIIAGYINSWVPLVSISSCQTISSQGSAQIFGHLQCCSISLPPAGDINPKEQIPGRWNYTLHQLAVKRWFRKRYSVTNLRFITLNAVQQM